MAESTGKNAAHIPGNGGYLADGPDLQEKKPTPYLYDAPTNAPHPASRREPPSPHPNNKFAFIKNTIFKVMEELYLRLQK